MAAVIPADIGVIPPEIGIIFYQNLLDNAQVFEAYTPSERGYFRASSVESRKNHDHGVTEIRGRVPMYSTIGFGQPGAMDQPNSYETLQYDLLRPETQWVKAFLERFHKVVFLELTIDLTAFIYPAEFEAGGTPFYRLDFPYSHGFSYWTPSWLPKNIQTTLEELVLRVHRADDGFPLMEEYRGYRTVEDRPYNWEGEPNRDEDTWLIRGARALTLNPWSGVFCDQGRPEDERRFNPDLDHFMNFIDTDLSKVLPELKRLVLPPLTLGSSGSALTLCYRTLDNVSKLLLFGDKSRYLLTLTFIVRRAMFQQLKKPLLWSLGSMSSRQRYLTLEEETVDCVQGVPMGGYVSATFQFHLRQEDACDRGCPTVEAIAVENQRRYVEYMSQWPSL